MRSVFFNPGFTNDRRVVSDKGMLAADEKLTGRNKGNVAEQRRDADDTVRVAGIWMQPRCGVDRVDMSDPFALKKSQGQNRKTKSLSAHYSV